MRTSLPDQPVVWITGGGSGLGRAMALEFAKRGADVTVSGRREDKLLETVALVKQAGGRGCAVVGDVTADADLERALEANLRAFGRLDVVVANAGYSVNGLLADLPRERLARQLDVNVTSAVRTAAIALPELLKTGGRIGLVGSVAAFTPVPTAGAYVASKAALLGLGRTFSAELAGSGVSCTTIQPGYVASEIGQVDDDGVFHEDWKDRRPKRLMWTSENAARSMVDALAARKVEHTFTGHGKFAVFLGRHLPWLVQAAVSRGVGRPDQ